MEELKPCPFCGGNDINIYEFKTLPAMTIVCDNCGVDIDFRYSKRKTKQAVRNNTVKLWNTRSKNDRY